eukprot:TRINITY_DN427_c0_g1_i1.p1 TRINITY_DN427_c0_g1~~TRINITY_DN427_c0_g1_i1.p1  ORF type:complete len:269 (+),score=39.23 TRINITY_DN427_c0_g1_i1:226-1032(+)
MGFPLESLASQEYIPSTLLCHFCKNILDRPVRLNCRCGLVCCHDCALGHLSQSDQCPHCGSIVSDDFLFDRLLSSVIDQLEFRCLNPHCKFTGTVSRFRKHRTQCFPPCQAAPCPVEKAFRKEKLLAKFLSHRMATKGGVLERSPDAQDLIRKSDSWSRTIATDLDFAEFVRDKLVSFVVGRAKKRGGPVALKCCACQKSIVGATESGTITPKKNLLITYSSIAPFLDESDLTKEQMDCLELRCLMCGHTCPSSHTVLVPVLWKFVIA